MGAQQLHRPVLFDEALAGLNIVADGRYLDGTFGRGGHSGAILASLGEQGRLLAIDKDPEAVAWGREQFAGEARFAIEQGSFAGLGHWLEQRGWQGRLNGLLLDLGVSSPQLDQGKRGFSFLHDGPLDMRMDNQSGVSAAEWLAAAEATEIAGVLKKLGEEKFGKRIASAIVQARAEGPILTTGQLAAIIAEAVPVHEPGRHPATRSFQAIRIFINRELEDLQACLAQAVTALAPGGRLVVISFHSLEDRIVKRFIREQVRGDRYPANLPVTREQLDPKLRACGKALRPTAAEVATNPRARSAVLRIAERLG